MFRTNILLNHVLNTIVLQLKLLTIIFLLLIKTDRSPDSEHVCEALSEPRRVLELDDSDLIGDHEIRYFYVVLCWAVLRSVTIRCVVITLYYVMSFYVQLFSSSFCSAVSCGSRHTALLSAHNTRIIIMLVSHLSLPFSIPQSLRFFSFLFRLLSFFLSNFLSSLFCTIVNFPTCFNLMVLFSFSYITYNYS
jgi:hypothetical protein